MRFSVRLDFFNENFLVAVRSRVFQSARVPAALQVQPGGLQRAVPPKSK